MPTVADPMQPSPGASPNEAPRLAPPPWRRPLVTLAGVALALASARVPMPFVDAGVFLEAVGDTGRLGLFALGLVPFLSASVVVEMVAMAVPRFRPLRHRGAAGRARLARAAWFLATLFAGVQGWSIARYLSVLRTGWGGLAFDAGSVPWLALSLAAASLLVAWLATKMGEAGLGDGFAVLLAAGSIADLTSAIQAARRMGLEDGVLLLWIALHAAVAFGAVRLVTWRRATADPRAPVPTSGLVPLHVGVSLLVFAASLSSFLPLAVPIAEALRVESTHGISLAVIALLLTLLLARLFCSPIRVASAWERAGRTDPEHAVAARAALAEANRRSVALIAGTALLPLLAHSLAVPFSVRSALAVVLVAAVALDLAAEARARAAGPEVVPAWPLHRVWAVEPILAALTAAGIPAWARTCHFRALFHVFAPYAPIEIMVPARRAEEASAICARVAIDPADA